MLTLHWNIDEHVCNDHTFKVRDISAQSELGPLSLASWKSPWKWNQVSFELLKGLGSLGVKSLWKGILSSKSNYK